MATSQTLLKSARQFHLYSGVFLAPALLFFAFTGGIQTFSLHEATRGSTYKPPAILVQLGQLHKKQTLVVPVRKGAPDDAKPGPSSPGGSKEGRPSEGRSGEKPDRAADRGTGNPAGGTMVITADPKAAAPPPPSPAAPTKVRNLLPMKIFFLMVSIGLCFSTLTGLYMSYKYARRKITITLTLLAGIAVPLLLLLI